MSSVRAKELLGRLENTQWLEPHALLALQLRQLERLLRHARETTAFYPGHWGDNYDPAAPIGAGTLARLPPLMRRDLQERFEDIKSRADPASFGRTVEGRSSGSSGTPVRVLKTSLTSLYWHAFTVREHLWHRRDFSGKLAVIRRHAGGRRSDNWGSSTRGLYVTGPAVGMDPSESVEAQLRWLQEQRPEYLLTYPSLAGELARAALASGTRLPSLKQVRTLGELLPPEVRELCREAWNVGVADTYSAEEVGYIALQCPEHEHYHVQSESVLVEIVDAAGRPCAPGEIGRVLVTSLCNFATPLVRYDLGDYAESGAQCTCGRGLPVLRRIVGRTRNMFVTARGERFWPSFGSRSLTDVAPIVQHQFVQKAHDLVEARLVATEPITPELETRLRAVILRELPAGVRVEFAYPGRIERGAGGKFEDFKSEVAAA